MDWRRGTRCPLKNRVITPVSRVIIPPLTHLFLAIYRGPIANTIFNNDRLGSHLKSLKIQASRLHHSRGYERRTTLGSCSTGGLDNGRMDWGLKRTTRKDKPKVGLYLYRLVLFWRCLLLMLSFFGCRCWVWWAIHSFFRWLVGLKRSKPSREKIYL